MDTLFAPVLAVLLVGVGTPWHMGSLHPLEKVLTLVLAFGPFLALGAVIWLRRRADARDEAATATDGEEQRPG